MTPRRKHDVSMKRKHRVKFITIVPLPYYQADLSRALSNIDLSVYYMEMGCTRFTLVASSP